jgi:hypothetical protein
MAGPFAAAGAVADPTRYSALSMQGEQFTGLWTQRSPYRDAATAYLVKKFYQGSRFDSELDGINREIFNDLTDGRRPGNPVWNSNPFGTVNSFYSFKRIQNGTEVISVLADDTDGNIYDTTGGGKVTLFTKATGGGSGGWKSRFLGVGNELFFSDRVEQKKWLSFAAWPGGSTPVTPGTLITNGEPGTIQMALGGLNLAIVGYSSNGTIVNLFVNQQQIPANFANLLQAQVTFSGFTSATFLNGQTLPIGGITSVTLGIFTVTLASTEVPLTPDTGNASTGSGITGTLPTFSATEFVITADAGQQWKCYGPAVQNWGLTPPTITPIVSPVNGAVFWSPNAITFALETIVDNNGNYQTLVGSTGAGKTGIVFPNFSKTVSAVTLDGNVTWKNVGIPAAWVADTPMTTIFGATTVAIIDSNGNIQESNANGTTGTTEPVWATARGAVTDDGTGSWINCGPGTMVTTAAVSYSFSTHAIDGSVSTAAPAFTIAGPILGSPVNLGNPAMPYLEVSGNWNTDSQIDQLWVWRTPQGQSTLIFEDAVPSDFLSSEAHAGHFTYREFGIPDTSTFGNAALVAFISAPIAFSNAPPPALITAPIYQLQRVWAAVGNTVVYSGGPNTLVGNGSTAFPPLNSIPFPGAVIKLRPITVQNGGILVYTTSGIWIIFGTGTPSNPFYETTYANKINLGGYDAEDSNGTNIVLMEANAKVSSLTIEYPFSPQSGQLEIGFPIGDQFLNVTTGGINTALYNPATTFLSWNVSNTKDSALYVADGAVGWFRMSQIQLPESGIVWSTRAAIAGGTSAVQSVETSPGIFQLLIAQTGKILSRDTTGTVFTDGGTAYPSWDAKGVILLCTTGQVTDISWFATKSRKVGSVPVVSYLMGEIAAGTTSPWITLQPNLSDPSNLQPSQTAWSARYSTQQNGNVPRGDCVLIKFDYGSQAFGDRLLEFAIYGSTEDERKQ